MDEREKTGLTLPDEAEYPRELTEAYELLELFSSAPGIATLLARRRADGGLATVKCFFAGFPLYDQSEPEALKKLDMPPLPRFLGEYKNERMRCVLHQYVAGETLAAVAAERRLSEAEEKGMRIRAERESGLLGLDGGRGEDTDFYEDEVFNVSSLPSADEYRADGDAQ